MANKPGYFEAYYEENKDEIAQKRKERYENDPQYREKVLKASRDYRARQRQGRRRVRMPRFQKPKIRETGDGGKIRLYSVGAFAASISRSVQAINHWEKIGILPRTPYRDGRGFRHYTTRMMESVQDQVGTKRRLFPVDPDMYDNICAAWEAGGVPVGLEAGDRKNQMQLALAETTLPDGEDDDEDDDE